MKRSIILASCGLISMGWFAACAGSPTTSTVRGQVAQETFASPVDEILVHQVGSNDMWRVPVAKDGSFQLVLGKKTKYAFSLQHGDQSTPLVLGGEHGKYTTHLNVASGGGDADIGLVRFFDPSIEGATPFIADLSPGADGDDDDACVDGYFEGSSEPCMADDAQLTCSADSDDDSDSDEDSDDDEDSEDGGVDCEDGIDPAGNECDGGPAANQDDGEEDGEDEDDGDKIDGPVAVPQHGLSDIDCGGDDDDGDSDDDDNEHEGEN